jgi:protein-tyrosine phosphatase
MIDLHCHLLPGIDDGAQDLEQALELARIAVADGIRVSVLTPHVHAGRYDNDRASIDARVLAFRAELEARAIALRVFGAGEVRLGPELMELLDAERLPFIGELGGDRVLLLEFPHSQIPAGAATFVRWLIGRKVRPLIAHPERNRDAIAAPARIKPFVDMGCLLQLTAGSLTGEFGAGAQAAADYFLRQEWVFAIATDAHDATRRPPRLAVARDALIRRGDPELAHKLTQRNPARLLGLPQAAG